MKKTVYNVEAGIDKGITIAHLSDLHGKKCDGLVCEVKQTNPDIIAITGDFGKDWDASAPESLRILSFLSKIAPTFYSLGNHEIGFTEEDKRKISETGTVVLDDSSAEACGVKIGGLTSGFIRSSTGNGKDNPHLFDTAPPNEAWLDEFEREEGYKILLCHHPEYYHKYLRNRKIDLVLSGHAHGGQVRLFGRGLIAPGQGFFPKYTSGVHDGRLIISRGLSNTYRQIPRIFNEIELVIVKIGFDKTT